MSSAGFCPAALDRLSSWNDRFSSAGTTESSPKSVLSAVADVADPASASVLNGSGIVSGAGMYEYGSVAVIIAEANPGWKFDYWEDGRL